MSNFSGLSLVRTGHSRKTGEIGQKGNTKNRFSLENIFNLIQEKKEFQIFYKNTDITKEVSEKAVKKYWSKKEENILKDNFGSVNLTKLRKEFLPKKTHGQIRHKADILALTIDRRWQANEITALTALRKSGCSYLQISKIMQRPEHACEVKAHKLGITHVGKNSEDYEGIDKKVEKYKNISPITKGKLAEDLSTIKLLENGIDVFTPYTPNHETDLIAVHENKIARLQVKSCIWDKKADRFRVPLQRKNPRTHERLFYNPKHIDFFILYCLGIDAIYIVPYSICHNYKSANLYPHRPKVIIDNKFEWE